MIKQTLYFGNPTYLSLKNKQLLIKTIKNSKDKIISRPIEDIGVVLLDNGQITITHNAIKALQDNKVALISCDDKHMPASLMLPMQGHTEQSRIYRYQIEASTPLKKQMWQQTVIAKIKNQNAVLSKIGKPLKKLDYLAERVQSGDPKNLEGQAAAYYWPVLFDGFTRDRYGEPPNNLLNYGYAVLRAMIARSLVSSGLLPGLGIFHRNKYNAYCLADDIMEPFRPFVDLLVYNMVQNEGLASFLESKSKARLLSVATMDARFGKKKSPLMVGMIMTTASLAACFIGKKRKIKFPLLI